MAAVRLASVHGAFMHTVPLMSISHHPFINLVLKYTDATKSSGNLFQSSITLWLKIFAIIQPYTFLVGQHFETISPSYFHCCWGENLEQSTLSKPRSILYVSINL